MSSVPDSTTTKSKGFNDIVNDIPVNVSKMEVAGKKGSEILENVQKVTSVTQPIINWIGENVKKPLFGEESDNIIQCALAGMGLGATIGAVCGGHIQALVGSGIGLGWGAVTQPIVNSIGDYVIKPLFGNESPNVQKGAVAGMGLGAAFGAVCVGPVGGGIGAFIGLGWGTALGAAKEAREHKD